ncbi:MAG: MBL fold metallo-hydrolase [Chitinophagales bacterium]|nr:MBL fold metallo-hydrolase [Chitinophagales bacterium]MDW8393689.1 MBL fold metallo-hydrolase [Chitinophagales bacterium]
MTCLSFILRILMFVVLWLAVLLGFGGCTNYGLRIKELAPDCYVVYGEGGNSGVLISDTAVLIVDTKMKQGAERLRRWVKRKAPHQRIYIVNTHIHRDHSSGNHLYDDAVIMAGSYGEKFWNALAAREDLPNRWIEDSVLLQWPNEEVVVYNVGQAHTYEDVLVYLRQRKVLFAGDVVLNGYHPFLDEHAGASVAGYQDVLQDMLQRFSIRWVVPGHGKAGSTELISTMQAYFRDMTEAAQNTESEMIARERYQSYSSLPINKAGFDQTISFIRKSETLR